MVITIDGPAGAGKSTVARALARQLGFRFLDTGAMYRCVAYAALKRDLVWSDADAIARMTRQLKIDVNEDRVLLDGEDVTSAIRTMEVTSVIHFVADNPDVRQELVHIQRRIGRSGDYVTEGRDQGTIVFPDAACKIFLTASPDERAKRRQRDLRKRGEKLSFEEVLAQQNLRDEGDRNREIGKLEAASDACLISSDHKTLDEVVQELFELATEKVSGK